MRWSGSRWIWLIVVCAGLLAALFVPAAAVYLVPGVAILCTLVAMWGLRVRRPPEAALWWTVAMGLGVQAAAYAMDGAHAGRWPDLQGPRPYGVVLALGMLILLVGTVLLLGRIHPSRDRGDLIDAVMVAVGLGSMLIQRMFGNHLAGFGELGIPVIVVLLFSVSSLLLLVGVVRVLLTGGRRSTTTMLLSAAVVATILAGVPQARLAGGGAGEYAHTLAVLAVLKFVLFAAAVTSADVTNPRLYAPAAPTLDSRLRQLIVALLAYLGPIVLTVAWLAGRPVNPLLPMVATVIIMVLSVMRVDQILRRMEHRASHDPLTDVLDRSTFHQTAVAMVSRGKGSRCLGILDIDDFKKINDTYGHLVGDEVLMVAARRLQASMRREDVVARFGGDEFALMFQAPYPEAVAQRLVSSLHKPMVVGGRELQVRVSLGISLLEAATGADAEEAVEEALRQADDAMYTVKGTLQPFAVAR